ncbi:MAG: NAD(P)/FAD-dependent oxidoreductase [Bacteroidales bacterium]|nr:NAD(P)/FAD-dependent oxidoreductase [Bacteroidales bacterium]
MKTVLIIGAGVGGLFTGALLAKEGFRVTVLEKNATIGGGLQNFTRFGEVFDTGMHVIGGMQPGGNVRKICEFLGILDKVSVVDVDDDCMDRLYFAEDRATYRLAKGKEAFVESLSGYFPSERDNLERYVSAIYDIAGEVDLFNLRPSAPELRAPSAEFLMAADDFIAKYIKDRRLRSVLAYMNPLYGGRGGQTPAYIHSIINVLYINGASRFAGGSARFADLLADVIKDAGGDVLPGDGVESISLENGAVCGVRTVKGNFYTADYYISAIHPCALLELIPPEAFTKAFRNRISSVPNAYSAFSMYIKLKPSAFPYINYSEYFMTRYDDIWNFGRQDKAWPLGFMCMTPPDAVPGPWASKMLVTAPMLFDEVRQWENTSVGHRGADYRAWKEERKDVLLGMMEELHPGFCSCVQDVNASSPLTIRDYYAVKEGSICGFSKDCNNIMLSQLPVVTKVPNLLLTGQNNNLHGFCGVSLTAITTCEAILGRNSLIEKIGRI